MKKKSPCSPMFMFFPCCSLFFIFIISSSAVHAINTTSSLVDGETILSSAATFALGFFSPGGSKNRYLGIWYNNISPVTVVWVANRETPLLDSSGRLRITPQGNLEVLNRTRDVIWSSNSSTSTRDPTAKLLDSGNLVVVTGENSAKTERLVWQSFDHPCDTLLPGAIWGVNRITGEERFLTSWKSSDDPSPGDYTIALESDRYMQVIQAQDSRVLARSGPWNGFGFNGEPGMKQNPYLKYNMVYNETEISFNYQLRDNSIKSRLVLSPSGMTQRFIWFNDTRGWVLFTNAIVGNCHRYGVCGPYGNCNINNFQICECLKGFEPKIAQYSNSEEWSKGCVRRTQFDCGVDDGFQKLSGIKLPDTENYMYHNHMSLDQCRLLCLSNCSCTAYTNPDITGATRACLLWFGDLIDIRVSPENPQDIYIRMAASELVTTTSQSSGGSRKSDRKQRVKKIIASSVAASTIMLLGLMLVLYKCWMKKLRQDERREEKDIELPFFDWDTIAAATDNFSSHNKLGEGGFGPVYKGVLKNGQEIAVKRLSMSSKQGLDEFKNEALYIAELQHRNLVRLLGYCVKLDEKMLIYEYMANRSLDFFIFDQNKSMELDWPKRLHIIDGIARGLLYLHQDSRLRIIHRDLKASNVLLDNEMNAKISDFGMARSCGENENERNTRRVVGTYGYMSPEYQIDGIYSTKSDIFSFGVLLLEIFSGKHNRGFRHMDHNLNLIGHAWKLYMEGRAEDLIDASLGNSHNPAEAVRLIHIGLLCVQRRPEDRPTMCSVVLMLSGDGALPAPKQPGFYNERDPSETDSSSSQSAQHGQPCPTNNLSITLLSPR